MKKTLFRIAAIVTTWALCFLIYLALCWSLTAQELILGALASFVVALFSARFLIRRNPVYLFSPRRFALLLLYLFVQFPAELIRANVDMARRAFSKKLPDNAGIVRIKTDMRSDYGLLMLANAITLTPGTITMETAQDEEENNYFYVHWIDVSAADEQKAGDAIKGRIEKWLGRIWE